MILKQEILNIAREYTNKVVFSIVSNVIHFKVESNRTYVSNLLPKGGKK